MNPKTLLKYQKAWSEASESRFIDYLIGELEKRVARDAKIIELLACATNELPSGDCHQTIYWINKALLLLEGKVK